MKDHAKRLTRALRANIDMELINRFGNEMRKRNEIETCCDIYENML